MSLAYFSKTIRAPWLRAFALLFVAAASAPVQGQNVGFTPNLQETLQQAAQRGALNDAFTGEAVPLEGALDPTEYVVGPGDVFTVSVGTAIPTDLNLTVTADGLLVVPSAGSYDVAGETLADARATVLAGLRRAYRNVTAEVALKRPRQFNVHVAGTVPHPGRHVVAPVARVEDALTQAMDGTSPVLVLQELRRSAALSGTPTFLPALRSIEVRRRDGTVDTVDLWRYYTSGDLRFNPYVRDGDVLYVPAYRDDLSAISVDGEIPNPGSYDYRAGDTVLDLLTIAAGPVALSELGTVRLVRRESGEAVSLDVAALLDAPEASPALAPGDRLIVAPRYLAAGVATAAGAVDYPGSYPIRPGETTVRELLDAAGGLRPDALVRGAYLERRGVARSDVYEPDQVTPFQRVPLAADIDPAVIEGAMDAEVSALTRNSELGFSGRQYYGRELLQPQRMSIDLGAVLRGSGPSIPLQDGDRLVVPRDPEAVLIVGQVGRPGYVPFEPGLSAEDYIARSGGRGTAAAEVYVRDAATGRIVPATDRPLQSGDYVFVDQVGVGNTPALQSLVLQERNFDFQLERERAERRYRLIQTGATLIGGVAAAVTAYVAIARLNE